MRYEVAIAIRSNNIVWVNGPFRPGEYNDLDIFRAGLIHNLDHGERVEADDGYIGECPTHCKCPGALTVLPQQQRMRARLRMRHESINEKIKNFQCLVKIFKHGLDKHSHCFHAAVVITQIALSGGEEFMDMREYDDNLTDAQMEHLYGI